MADRSANQIIHATCISIDGKAMVICGAPGSGKSALALQLLALGAALVSDDRTELRAENGTLVASAPATIAGLIEARGVGILNAPASEPTKVVCAVDLDKFELERLPERHEKEFFGVRIPCLHKIEGPHFPAAVLQYLKSGRRDPS